MSDQLSLPEGWEPVTLGDILTIVRGVTYNKADVRKGAGDGLVPILRATNIDRTLNFDDLVYVPKKYVSEVQMLRPGDIVIAASSGSQSVVGKAAQLTSRWTGSFGAFCMGLRVSPEIDNRFVAYFLQSIEYRHRVSLLSAGSNINNLKREHIQSAPFRLAPHAEQGRIVAKIDELFSELDVGVTALKRVKANLKRYRASVLKAAVEGALTKGWRRKTPTTEPAGKLLIRILDERRKQWEKGQLHKYGVSGKTPAKGWKEKYETPITVNAADLPSLPREWTWATVDQLISYLRNGWSLKPDPSPPGYQLLRINAVRPMAVDFSEVRYVNRPIEEVNGYFVEEGDLLFTRYNGSVDLLGVCGLVKHVGEPTLHPDKLIRVKTVLSYPLNAFVEIAANVGASRKHIAGKARTTAGQTGISGTDIRQMPVPLCPTNEQEQIVLEVERRLSVIQAAETEVEHGLKRAARLRQAILKRAFEGKLVPQDPADESAQILLNRIRREREQDSKLSLKVGPKPHARRTPKEVLNVRSGR